VLKYKPRLHLGDTREQFDEIRQRHDVFQVLEQGCHRDPGAAKYPDSADPLGIPLNGNATSPTEIGL
jgi:hypothetical protein